MANFLQLHLITTYGPSCLNRDDTGRPKIAVLGGVERLRISSQSLKRAWRKSSTFKEAVDKHLGTRTRRIGDEVIAHLEGKQIDKKKAEAAAAAVTSIFRSDKKKGNGGGDDPIFLFSKAEFNRALDAAEAFAEGKIKAIAAGDILLAEDTAVDIAMWGRMLAASPDYNREAAVQVAHAITTHRVMVEDDYFSAVDDLGDAGSEEGLGAAHIGVREFGAGTFYIYICVDRELLRRNLSGNADLAAMALEALVRAAAMVSPSGHQASYASRAYASYVLAETGNQQPRSLVGAFTRPVTGQDQIGDSVKRLTTFRGVLDATYGQCWTSSAILDASAEKPAGSLSDIVMLARG
jgi:CRISPR system Cascade subunit CasC